VARKGDSFNSVESLDLTFVLDRRDIGCPQSRPAFTAQDIGGKEGISMKSRIKYTEELMGGLRAVRDFLPPPDQLVLKEDNVKVTISLKKSSVSFFKKEAKKHSTSYQKTGH
jgi:hypothetical protein